MGKNAAKRKRAAGNGTNAKTNANNNTNNNNSTNANNNGQKQLKKQKQASRVEDDEGEDVDFSSLGFADALSVGLAFQQLGAADSAVLAYARAVELQPAHYSALCRLADACADAGEFSDARKHYAAASNLPEAASDASLWLRLGMAQAETEAHDGAIKSYKKAKTLAQPLVETDGDAEAKRTYGMALAAMANALGVEKGDVDGAVKVYEDAVEAFPQNANLHFNLATMLLAKGDVKRAVTSLKTAIETDGEVVEFYEELVGCLEDGDEKDEYVKKMEEMGSKQSAEELDESKEGEEEEEKEEEEEEEEDDEDDEEDEDEEDEEDEDDE